MRRRPAYFASMIIRNGDTAINVNPTGEQLVAITSETVCFYKDLSGRKPIVSMLYFSNFNSNDQPETVKIIKEKYHDTNVDGEIHANMAANREFRDRFYPFNDLLNKNSYAFTFQDLNAGNIAYKLLYKMGGSCS